MERKTISRIADDAIAKMEELGFAEYTVSEYRRLFNQYAAFASARGCSHHSESLGQSFLDEKYAADTRIRSRARRACDVIGYFEATGEIPGRTAYLDVTPPESSAHFLELFIADCAERGLAPKTIAARNREVCQFLQFVEDSGASFPGGVDAALIDSWAEDRHEATPGNVGRCLSSVRCFLTHLFCIGATETNLSALVPSRTRYPTKPATKVWTDEEVEALVTTITTGDAAGKRDKAICMLHATYGMRSVDVCGLRLSDLDFDACTITFTQSKTKAPNTLPMTDGVAWALADWILNGRPERASCDEVFTSLRAPFGPMGQTYYVVTRRMEAAGITKVPGASSGPHSMRHTVATKMVSKGTPLPVVSSVLGHAGENTTMIYLHADIEGLRRCALGEGVM